MGRGGKKKKKKRTEEYQLGNALITFIVLNTAV